ncbi:MAG: SRPBCC family protein [Deltaproteobacteria bacterium]|nr:MAG: SRPBCC family protein [Deltaproteobacteria bacterium]
MGLMKDVTLTDSIEIRTTPETVFDFLVNLVDDEGYRAWHPEDHVALRWLKGKPWEEGSLVYAEEYIHGKLHKLKFVVTKIVPNSEIEYVPGSRFLRRYFPNNKFIIEPKEGTCVFTATGTYRIGWLARTFAKRRIERGLSSVRKHMKEEGENLKRLLEAKGSSHKKDMDTDTH